jgi:nucleoside-diphosphate-sugar epimerase
VVTEATPLGNPYWKYARDKIACEEYLSLKYRETGFPVTIVRPSLTYQTMIPIALGGSRDFTVPDRMLQGRPVIIHGDGSSLWTVTHAEDFARGFVGLLGHQQAGGHAFHITSDEILTWNQIYEALADALGVKGQFVHIASDFICRFDPEQEGRLLGDKAVSAIFDNTKIKRFVPGYQAVIPFKTGIARTIRWFMEEPSRRRVVEANNKLIDGVIAAYAVGLQAIAAKGDG